MQSHFKNIPLTDLCILAVLSILILSTSIEHIPAVRKISVALLVAIIVIYKLLQKESVFTSFALSKPFVLWGSFCFLSFMWSVNQTVTFHHLKSDLVPAILGFYIFFEISKKTWSDSALIYLLTAQSAINFILSLIHFYSPLTTLSYFYAGYGFASTLSLMTLMVSIACMYFNSRPMSAFMMFIFSICTGILSGNRMWLVICGLVIIPFFFIIFKKISRKLKITLLFLIVAIALLFQYSTSTSVHNDREVIAKYSHADLNNDPRLIFWSTWIDVATEKPLLGNGYGRMIGKSALSSQQQQKLNDIDTNSTFHSHNIFLNTVIETGLIGLILFISMWIFFIKNFYLHRNNIYGLCGVLLVVTFLLKNLTDMFFVESIQMLILGLTGFYFGKIQSISTPTKSSI